MKKYLLLLITIAFIGSCTSYHVKSEIKKKSELKKFKQSGIIIRKQLANSIELNHYNQSLSHWLSGYKKINNLTVITETSEKINTAQSEFEQFVQFSMDDDFLLYKTIGIISQFVKENEEELKAIITENGLDSLIIYEVGCIISPEMQFLDFGSIILIMDSEFNIVYLDHQFDTYDTFEYDPEIMKNNLLDKINDRLLQLMFKYDYITEE